jgi:hypothetical protein
MRGQVTVRATHAKRKCRRNGSACELRINRFACEFVFRIGSPTESDRLTVVKREREVSAVAVEDTLAAFHERELTEQVRVSVYSGRNDRERTHLQVEVLQDFDERRFQARNFETVLDTTNQSQRIDLCANVFE